MKKFTAMLVMVCVVLNAGFAFADVTVDVNNSSTNAATATGGNANQNQNQNQTQSEWQAQQQRMQSIITTPGNMPVAGTHAIAQTANQTGDYGRLITNSQLAGTSQFFCGMSGLEFGVMVKVINREGAESWDDVNGKIIPYPFIRKELSPLAEGDKVYMPSGEMALLVLRTSLNSQIVGGWFYDSKFKKDNSVLKAHLQMRARIDAAKVGANVVIAVDEFDQRYFVPENFEFSVSGVLSWISRTFLSGGSVAASAGMVTGQNSAFARPGAGFIFLRIEGITDEICYELVKKSVKVESKVVVKEEVSTTTTCDPSVYIKRIAKTEARIAKCFRWCHYNMAERLKAAKDNIRAHLCTGEEKYLKAAIQHLEMAELNSIHGFDIKSHSDSNAIIAEVEYYLASAFFARDGSIENFWKAPRVVKHENKKTAADKWVSTTSHEKTEILKIRRTLERYSTKLTLK